MSNYTFSTATRDEVKSIILTNHYAHRMPMVQYAFKITDGILLLESLPLVSLPHALL